MTSSSEGVDVYGEVRKHRTNNGVVPSLITTRESEKIGREISIVKKQIRLRPV